MENNNKVGIYSLSNAAYLRYDIEKLFSEIDLFYDVNYSLSEISVKSKILIDSNVHWASDKNKENFNSLMPKIKALHQAMYGIVEAVSKEKEGKFKKKELEESITNFKEFRLLNNQFKHFSQGEVKIDVISINYLLNDEIRIMDISCQFMYPGKPLVLIPWSDFILTFLAILEKYEVIAKNEN